MARTTSARVARAVRNGALVVAALAAAASARAATVVWGHGADVTGDSDVMTTGDLVMAYKFGGAAPVSSPTINGVTFSSITLSGSSPMFLGGTGYTSAELIIGDDSSFVGYDGVYSASDPFASLSSDYRGLLSGFGGTNDDPFFTIKFESLVVGREYYFQAWASFTDGRIPGVVTLGMDVDGAVDLATNTGVYQQPGGVGQWVVGTFTADTWYQDVYVKNPMFDPDFTRGVYLNAFQLREEPRGGVIPEPSSWVLIALGAGASLGRLRRRGAAAE